MSRRRAETYTNCPNCGAPVTGDVCPYCSTVFGERPLDLAIGKVVTVSFENDNAKYEFRFLVRDVQTRIEAMPTFAYNDLGFKRVISTDYQGEATFSGLMVPDDDGKLMVARVK